MCCLDAHMPVLQHTTPTSPVRHSITVADINKVGALEETVPGWKACSPLLSRCIDLSRTFLDAGCLGHYKLTGGS